ncbi:MAG: 4Fe-4S dicluster domain-containing protein [Bacteroidota bacterium]
MIKQIFFFIMMGVTFATFFYTTRRIWLLFGFTKSFPIGNWGKRFILMMKVAIGQTKIFRKPVTGFMHALVFWGFCLILFGSVEMVIDGFTRGERRFSALGALYNALIALGDVFAAIIAVAILFFLIRRLFHGVKRFEGIEMKKKSHLDANIALSIIFILMISLLGMNAFYIALNPVDYAGVFPVSVHIASLFAGMSPDGLNTGHEINWWLHIGMICIFANILPYSKHFHVFMSIPNVFLSRLEPLGKLPTMARITTEVKMMMNPDTAFAEAPAGAENAVERFGVKDVEDVHWKNYLDSLSCTECGRCTASCPANTTGKKLSPRKIFMDLRARMKEKGSGMVKNGKDFIDNKSLLRDFITEEELWACTTCNACAKECPVNINHPTFIVDMRRYLVMEEGSAPAGIKSMLTNIENNGAPWQFSPEDRMKWAEELYINN